MRVWERGSGETLACGTGACASLVASVLNGKSRPREAYTRRRELLIDWDKDTPRLYYRPCRVRFDGETLF